MTARLPIAFAVLLSAPFAVAEPSFEITIDPAVHDEPFTGRLYVAFAPDTGAQRRQEPRNAMHAWFNPPPVFAIDVRDLKPGEPVTISGDALGHPQPLAETEAGEFFIQGVARVNLDSPKAGAGAGDLYSVSQSISFDPESDTVYTLTLNNIVPEPVFEETDRIKLFEMRSPAMSAFHGRDFTVRAGIRLPENHDPSKEYPVVVFTTGFGGDHTFIRAMDRILGSNGFTPDAEPDAIYVVPDPLCFRGHSVFADSANNGPWGAMLVHELLPAIDEAFGGAGPDHRFVTGVSSGGWSSLWLQVTYPDHFAGVWSHVPDPVSFLDFQQVDLLADNANIFYDENGDPRPLARRGDEVILLYKDFVGRETVLGPGGQIHSFEAVFSPRNADGTPRPLFDRETGAVDPVTARAWAGYDINQILIEQWQDLGPKLAGKLVIHAGEVDNFYLEGAVEILGKTLSKLESDAEVKVIEGMAHSLSQEAFSHMMERVSESIEALK